tara:strand:+ start:10514 stop:11665 length:1152 start_codon:yes stop_codon:yes gene_type:complete
MRLRISKPDDSSGYYECNITCETFPFAPEQRVSFLRQAKDPIQAGLEKFWRTVISPRRKNSWRNPNSFKEHFHHIVFIEQCPVVLSREGIRYQLNGKSYSLATICSALARITYKACFEKDGATLLSSLYATLDLPENVKYCLENRAPYHFHENMIKQEVRLNVMQIDDKMLAMEISDGIWGEITPTQLDSFCNFYLHGKKRGSWKTLGPKKLYTKLMGREPSRAEDKVMRAFLMQNRMQDIVDARALELVADLLKQHAGKISAKYDSEGTLVSLYIRGKHYDWKLTNNRYKSGIQMVSTFVWQPNIGYDEDEEGNKVKIFTEPKWQGPICIDNMAEGSPLGDQFATRALALINDFHTIKIVNTIKVYLKAGPNEYRIDNNDLR